MTSIQHDLHMHTLWSDGENTPREMIDTCAGLGYQLIALTDHVRRSTDWFSHFTQEIQNLRNEYRDRIKIAIGFEAKILNPEGELDATAEMVAQADLVIGAIHSIPTDDGPQSALRHPDPPSLWPWWKRALENLCAHPDVDIIAHVGAMLPEMKHEPSPKEWDWITERLIASGKVIEYSARYNTPPPDVLQQLSNAGCTLVLGSDSHNKSHLGLRKQFVDSSGIKDLLSPLPQIREALGLDSL